jgi:hypothetical protein
MTIDANRIVDFARVHAASVAPIAARASVGRAGRLGYLMGPSGIDFWPV